MRAAVDRAFPEAEFTEILEKKDFVLELENRFLAALGDQRLNQRERFKNLAPLFGLALQAFENVLEHDLAVFLIERVLRDTCEVSLRWKVQLVRRDVMQLVLESRLGQTILSA